ncbi:MAG: hypothetical protein SO136_06275 [Sarcina ventriculi]|nr:hypothetical protein [Sarcina ventriculi]MDY7062501.1 hypothetical protein [Sarcina ventriculi]
MMVNLPLRLTGSGNPGYRIPNTVTITYSNGRILRNVGLIDTSITTSSFTMDMSSGYDSNVNRITNIVGYNGQYLLKYCPQCGHTKPTIDFDWSGRVTTGRRDQSDCNNCRGSY